jgi:hypothetical protein
MPYLLIKVASFVLCVTLLMRLCLYYSSYLSLSAYIHSFVKLTLLAVYTIAISYPIYDLGCVFFNLHI